MGNDCHLLKWKLFEAKLVGICKNISMHLKLIKKYEWMEYKNIYCHTKFKDNKKLFKSILHLI